MSKDIVVMIKIVAKPRGLANVIFGSAKLTVSPVIVGFKNAKVMRRIAETMFSMNNGVFMVYSLT